MSEQEILESYVIGKMTQTDQTIFAFLYKYAETLFDMGAGLPKIQVSWRTLQNLPQ